MCPACLGSAALMAGSVISTGGVSLLAVKIFRRKKHELTHGSKEDSKDDGSKDKEK